MRWMTSGFAVIALALVPAAALADPDNPHKGSPPGESQANQPPDQGPAEVDTFEWSTSSGPRLGIMATGLTPELRAFYGAPADRGVLIAHVDPRSPAARAGLRVGDVLVALRGQPISGADDVRDALSNLNPGEAFQLSVVRARKAITLRAALPQSDQAAPQGSERC